MIEKAAEEKMTEEQMKELLKKYLNQYCKNRNRKRMLECRLKNFRIEMLGNRGIDYSQTGKSGTNRIIDAPADFSVRCEEIIRRINKEQKSAATSMLKIMDMLDFLPADSAERLVMECKYLDGRSWKDIETMVSMSKSRCIDYWNDGLDKLLKYKKIQKILEDYGRNVTE